MKMLNFYEKYIHIYIFRKYDKLKGIVSGDFPSLSYLSKQEFRRVFIPSYQSI